MKIAIVTGASSGMGRDFVLQLDQRLRNTDEIWLLGRNKDSMDELASLLEHKARSISVDLTDKLQVKQFAEVLHIAEPKITVLVNCAGYGKYGTFESYPEADDLNMVQLNVLSLTQMTKLCLPYMRKGSKMIQVASGAAFLPQSKFAVYAATKSYVYSFSRALSRELKHRKISVTTVCPGPVDTPFIEKAYRDEHMSKMKRLAMSSSEKVVATALDDSCRKKKVSLFGLIMKILFGATQSVNEIIGLFMGDGV